MQTLNIREIRTNEIFNEIWATQKDFVIVGTTFQDKSRIASDNVLYARDGFLSHFLLKQRCSWKDMEYLIFKFMLQCLLRADIERYMGLAFTNIGSPV